MESPRVKVELIVLTLRDQMGRDKFNTDIRLGISDYRFFPQRHDRHMIPKPIDAIKVNDLQNLVEIGRPEDRHIDFKLNWSKAAFAELAKDDCAFANTDGGDIIIGMSEADGIAAKVLGVDCNAVDRQIRNTETGIRSRIEPPVSGMRVRAISLDDGKIVFVIRILASPQCSRTSPRYSRRVVSPAVPSQKAGALWGRGGR
jgi:hypothetical protein